MVDSRAVAPLADDAKPAAAGPRPNVRLLVAWNVRRLRVSLGVSQRDLSIDSKTDLSYLSGLERGQQNPTIETLDKLAQALGAALVDLVQEPLSGAVAPLALKRGRKRAAAPET